MPQAARRRGRTHVVRLASMLGTAAVLLTAVAAILAGPTVPELADGPVGPSPTTGATLGGSAHRDGHDRGQIAGLYVDEGAVSVADGVVDTARRFVQDAGAGTDTSLVTWRCR